MTEPCTPLPWQDTADRYGRISIALHWTTAPLVIVLIALGQLMEWTIHFDDQSLYISLKYAHIAIGAGLAMLVVPRLAWRAWSGWPVLRMRSGTLKFLARLIPSLLLAGILLQTISGVLARWSARNWPTYEAAQLPLLGIVDIPSPFEMHQPALNRITEAVHDTTADILLILLAVHVLAAVTHVLVRLNCGEKSP